MMLSVATLQNGDEILDPSLIGGNGSKTCAYDLDGVGVDHVSDAQMRKASSWASSGGAPATPGSGVTS